MADQTILSNVKKYLEMSEDVDGFDDIILMYINSNLTIANQLGAKFVVVDVDDKTTWDDLQASPEMINILRLYLRSKTKILWDPPSGALLEALKDSVRELEFRLRLMGELQGDEKDEKND